MKSLLIIITALFTINISRAQIIEPDEFLGPIMNSISQTYKTPIDERIIIFSASIFVNDRGVVDSLRFSNSTLGDLSFLLNKKNIIKDYLSRKNLFVNYKNSVIVIPIFYKNMNEYSAKFLVDTSKDFRNLYPKNEEVKGRKLYFARPSVVSVSEDKEDPRF